MIKWEKSMVQSFKKISPRNAVKGLDRDIKDLMEEERWIKKNVLDNAERCRVKCRLDQFQCLTAGR